MLTLKREKKPSRREGQRTEGGNEGRRKEAHLNPQLLRTLDALKDRQPAVRCTRYDCRVVRSSDRSDVGAEFAVEEMVEGWVGCKGGVEELGGIDCKIQGVSSSA